MIEHGNEMTGGVGKPLEGNDPVGRAALFVVSMFAEPIIEEGFKVRSWVHLAGRVWVAWWRVWRIQASRVRPALRAARW